MVEGPGTSEAGTLNWLQGILWVALSTLICTFFFDLVAEQAESIDNPLHEAAKRGRSDSF